MGDFQGHPFRGNQYTMSTMTLTTIRDVNRNVNPKPGHEGLVESIRREGVKTPLVIGYDRRTGKVVLSEGNSRLAAARAIGIQRLPVRFEPMVLEGDRSPSGDFPLRSIPVRKDARGWTRHPSPEEIISDLEG